MDRTNKEMVKIAKKYNLNPGMLRDILNHRTRGMNNIQIATRMGINKNTVSKYVNALNDMNQSDFVELLTLVAIIGAGAIVINSLLHSILGDEC